MDSSDIATANGLPFAFEQYEIFKNGIWEKVKMGFQQIRIELDFKNLMNGNKLKLHKGVPSGK